MHFTLTPWLTTQHLASNVIYKVHLYTLLSNRSCLGSRYSQCLPWFSLFSLSRSSEMTPPSLVSLNIILRIYFDYHITLSFMINSLLIRANLFKNSVLLSSSNQSESWSCSLHQSELEGSRSEMSLTLWMWMLCVFHYLRWEEALALPAWRESESASFPSATGPGWIWTQLSASLSSGPGYWVIIRQSATTALHSSISQWSRQWLNQFPSSMASRLSRLTWWW